MNWTDKICVAAFQNRDNARQAVKDLEKSGFDHDQVGIVHRDEKIVGNEKKGTIGRDHATGAGSGALLGTILGGAATFVFPPAGTLLVAGAIIGLATGAITGGIAGALTGLGIPKPTAEFYQREIEAGRAVVVVMCEGRQGEALKILHNHGGYQLDESGLAADDQQLAGASAPVNRAPVVADNAAGRNSSGPPLPSSNKS